MTCTYSISCHVFIIATVVMEYAPIENIMKYGTLFWKALPYSQCFGTNFQLKASPLKEKSQPNEILQPTFIESNADVDKDAIGPSLTPNQQ